MKILVTGGAGFIGSHLCHKLIKKGHQITIADIEKNVIGHSFNENYAYRKQLIAGVKFIHTRCSHSIVWRQKYDAVVHLAQVPVINPLETVQFLEDVQEMIELTRRAYLNGVQKFVYLSSTYVYGSSRGEIFTETSPLAPQDEYGLTKAASELILRLYFKDRDWQIVRTAGVYGYGDHNRRFSRLVVELYDQLPKLEVTGGARRNFIYIDDLVTGLVKVVESKLQNQIYNLVGATATLEEFVKRVKKHKPQIKYSIRPLPKNEVVMGEVDTSKARKFLNFVPSYSLKEGIDRYLEIFHQQSKTYK